jgi:hypothetical protein
MHVAHQPNETKRHAEVPEQWRLLTQECGAHIVVLDTPLLDTHQKRRDVWSIYRQPYVANPESNRVYAFMGEYI